MLKDGNLVVNCVIYIMYLISREILYFILIYSVVHISLGCTFNSIVIFCIEFLSCLLIMIIDVIGSYFIQNKGLSCTFIYLLII